MTLEIQPHVEVVEMIGAQDGCCSFQWKGLCFICYGFSAQAAE